MKQVLNRKHVFRIVFIILNMLFVFLPHCFDVYLDGDDIGMLFIASGIGDVPPNEHTIFTNIIYGWLLKALYTTIPSIEWYSVILYAANMIFCNVLVFLIYKSRWPYLLSMVATAFVLIQGVGIALSPQFTIGAGELGLASVMLVYKQDRRKRYILSFLLFVLGAIIRTDAALIPYVIFLPLLLFPVRLKNIVYKHNIVYFVSLLVVVVGIKSLHSYVYHASQDWAEYTDYNKLRGYIQDNPFRRAPDVVNHFKEQYKRDAYELFLMREPDGSILSMQDLQDVVSILESKKVEHTIANTQSFRRGPLYGHVKSLAVFVVACILLMFVNKERKYMYLLLGSVLLMFALANLYTFATSFPKYRVFIIMYVSVMAAIATCAVQIKSKHSIAYACLILASVLPLYSLYRTGPDRYDMPYKSELELICSKYEGGGSKLMRSCHIGITHDAFDLHNNNVFKNSFSVGWGINSPLIKPLYSGLRSYIDGDIVFVYLKRLDTLELTEKLLKEYYHIDVQRKVLMETNELEVAQLICHIDK